MTRLPGTTPTGPTLTFLGAVGTVTGSRFLVEGAASRVLVDAGLFQGLAELRRRNWDEPDLDPATVGGGRGDPRPPRPLRLPAQAGPRRASRAGSCARARPPSSPRSCCATAPTCRRRTRRTPTRTASPSTTRRCRSTTPPTSSGRCPSSHPVGYDEQVALAPGISVTLRPAGHILGSATALVEVDGARVLFSGDLGRPHHPLLLPPADPPAADVVVVESTYGDRTHPPPDDELLASAVRRTVAARGLGADPGVRRRPHRAGPARARPAPPCAGGSRTSRSTSTARWRWPALAVYRRAATDPGCPLRHGRAGEDLLRISGVHPVQRRRRLACGSTSRRTRAS